MLSAKPSRPSTSSTPLSALVARCTVSVPKPAVPQPAFDFSLFIPSPCTFVQPHVVYVSCLKMLATEYPTVPAKTSAAPVHISL
ncbi:hypothetical protein MVEN_02529500 [Mycena venus]|uniref:Uncharacterized protein n=1 Tax=Mycena venus TaxID=2733690 RepID=A0A8H6WUS6_9AGAR|nr:hypothetical protein MVEN_02529500 [Mycena venus]